jgi:hypothetical protein
MGFKNSSSRSSPGVTSLSLRIFLLHRRLSPGNGCDRCDPLDSFSV